MINLIFQWLRDNFRWTSAAEADGADLFHTLHEAAPPVEDDEAERNAVMDIVNEQRRDASAFYIPLL